MAVHFLTRQNEVDALLPVLMAQREWGVDTETTGLDPHKSEVILLQFGRNDHQYVIDTRQVRLESLKPFFDSMEHLKIFHNAKFDYKMIKRSKGIEVENMRDTFLAEKLITVGLKLRGFSLADVLLSYLNVFIEKDLQKSFADHKGDFSQQQIEYAATDVRHLVSLWTAQCNVMRPKGLGETALLECAVVPCFGDMELGGMILDAEHWKSIIEENKREAEKYRLQLNEYAKSFFPVTLFGDVDINYNSPAQSLELLNRMRIRLKEQNPITKEETEIPLPDTSDKTLKKVIQYPVVALLQEYRSLQVLINTFGQPFLDAIHPVTRRIHPDFAQLGTETGRPSSGNSPVNFLNVPREKRYRKGFISGDDYVIETDDYSGCELRILAELSKDPQLCGAFNKGADVHCYVSSKLYGVEVTKKNEHAHLRTPGKTINFGIIYKMGVKKLHEKLNGDGFKIEFDEARRLYNKYVDEFRVAVDFLRNTGRLAAQQGWLRNINGRIRNWRLPDTADVSKYPLGDKDPKYQGTIASIEREGGNFVIQSVNADLTKQAMVWLREYRKKYNVRTEFVNVVYDEIVTRTHKDDSPVFVEAKREIMLKAAEKWIRHVPMEVDGHICPHWTK